MRPTVRLSRTAHALALHRIDGHPYQHPDNDAENDQHHRHGDAYASRVRRAHDMSVCGAHTLTPPTRGSARARTRARSTAIASDARVGLVAPELV